MTTKQINSKAIKLFNKWIKEFCNNSKIPNHDYYKKLDLFRKECLQLHNVVGCYEYLTDKNALKMASICSSLRFVEPFRMLIKLQYTTNSY